MDFLIIAVMIGTVFAMYLFRGEETPRTRLVVYIVGFVVFVSPPIVVMLYGAVTHARVGLAMIGLGALAWIGAVIGGKFHTVHQDGALMGIIIALLLGAGPLAAIVFK